jgi:hypothetical protein
MKRNSNCDAKSCNTNPSPTRETNQKCGRAARAAFLEYRRFGDKKVSNQPIFVPASSQMSNE